MTTGPLPRGVFIMVDEVTIDNLLYLRESMINDYKLQPENITDIIAVLINYWCDGKRIL